MKIASPQEISSISKKAMEAGFLTREDTSAIFINLDIVDDRLNRLKSSFPDGTQHAISIKTNPLGFILKHIVNRGFGLEAASMSELKFGVAAGISLDKLVFDAPAKTQQEIEILESHFKGCRVNADSIEELERYSTSTGLSLGLRINPLFSNGTQSSMNVGGAFSKFGEPISKVDDIIQACLHHEEVDCLHLHIGSQTSNTDLSIKAILQIIELAKKINKKAGWNKISTIDIGGGFPVNYQEGPSFEIAEYARNIRKSCPEFWEGDFHLITEFGRYIHANAAWCLSDIEYSKDNPNGKTITTQLGADMFLRECYNPGQWTHGMFVMDQKYSIKDGSKFETRVGGPLCFGGDYIGESQSLVECSAGDKLVIRDVGANSFSLWSRHCSRPFPKVISYSISQGLLEISKSRESDESILNFWT